MQILKLMSFSFWCGAIAMGGLHMLIQDWYGLEGYIEFCRRNWVDLHWLVGATIAGVALVGYAGRRLRVIKILERPLPEEMYDEKSD